jgi:hypothetical protein
MKSMTGFGNTQQQNTRLYTMIIILGMWIELIPLNKIPLGPLSLVKS